jgi:hemerythrin-like domain-containing protein
MEVASFLELTHVHAGLDAIFRAHQEALVRMQIDVARERLAEFEAAIRVHIRVEEALLLPVYRRAGPIPGGAPELYLTEHRKMLEYLERFRETLSRLTPALPDLPREIIALLDHEALFKHLMEHHDLREHNLLYPTCDRVTGEEERRELLAGCFPEGGG